MATSIGSLNIKVGADSGGLSQDLGKMQGALDTFGKTFARSFDTARVSALSDGLGKALVGGLGKIGTTLPGLLKGAFTGLLGYGETAFSFFEKAFTNPARALANLTAGIGNLVSQIPLIGGLLALPFEAVSGAMGFALDTYTAGARKIKDLAAGAFRTGMDLGQFQLLSQAFVHAGISAEAGEKGLFMFQRKLAEAQLAAVGTRTEFDRLGVDGKALAELASTDMPAAFGVLSDRISGMANGSQRAWAAFQIFGKGGAAMLPLLMKGSAEIAKQKEWMDRFGTGFGFQDLASVRKADEATKMLGLFKEGFANQATIAVAPVLAEMAEMLPKLTFGAKGLADTLVNGMESAASAGAYLVDNWGDWDTLWTTLEVGWNRFIGVVQDGIADVLAMLPDLDQGMAKAFGQSAGLASNIPGPMGTIVGSIFGAQGNAFQEAADAGGTAKALKDRAKARREQAQAASDWLWLQQQDMEQQGMDKAGQAVTSFFGKVRDRMKTAGQDSGAGFMAGFLERFQKIEDAVKGPLDHFRDKVGEVQALMAGLDKMGSGGSGLVNSMLAATGQLVKAAGGFTDTLYLSLGKAAMDFTATLSKAQHAAVMELGSKEAYSTILNYQESGKMSVQDAIKAAVELAIQQRAEQIRIGKETAEALKGLKLDVKGI